MLRRIFLLEHERSSQVRVKSNTRIKLVRTNKGSALSAVPEVGRGVVEGRIIFGLTRSINIKVFRNKEGTHILMIHPSYKGTIDGKDLTPQPLPRGLFRSVHPGELPEDGKPLIL